jgi:hypothetical protein
MIFYDIVTVTICCYKINKYEYYQLSMQSSWENKRVNTELVSTISDIVSVFIIRIWCGEYWVRTL